MVGATGFEPATSSPPVNLSVGVVGLGRFLYSLIVRVLWVVVFLGGVVSRCYVHNLETKHSQAFPSIPVVFCYNDLLQS